MWIGGPFDERTAPSDGTGPPSDGVSSHDSGGSAIRANPGERWVADELGSPCRDVGRGIDRSRG
jgi:hypothetical protein